MTDQREHGVGGLEWRDRPAGAPHEPLVPSTGKPGDSVDEAVNAGAQARDDSDHDDQLDLSAVYADDLLLNSVGSFGAGFPARDAEPELRELLQSWRLDVDAEPIGELVGTDAAMLRIADAARRHRRRRPRYLVPLASAAAVLVVAFTGMGLAARDAQPGDTLWGLSQVLYADHARSVEAAAAVRVDLSHASEALQQGHLREARTQLALAQNSLPSVSTEDGQADLSAQRQNLLDQLNATVTGPTPTTVTTIGSSVTSTTTTTTTTTPPPTTTQPTTTTPTPSTTTPTTTTPTPTTSSTTPTIAPQSSTVSGGGTQAQPALPVGPDPGNGTGTGTGSGTTGTSPTGT